MSRSSDAGKVASDVAVYIILPSSLPFPLFTALPSVHMHALELATLLMRGEYADSLMILILVARQDPLQSLWLRVPAGREPGVQCDCHVLSVVRQYEDQH